MNNQQDGFFFEIQEIPDNSIIFEELKKEELFFSYFQVDQKYYLFFYGQKFIDIDFIDPFIHIIEELNTKQRKIRSLRGFFLYALEIMDSGKDLQILRTNLKPSFWRTLKTILRQNKKIVLLQFLFGSQSSDTDITDIRTEFQSLKETIESLQNQVNSLHQKLIELEKNQTLKIKKCLSELLNRSQATKIDQQGDYSSDSSLTPQSGNLLPNDSEVRNPTSSRKGMESKSVSDPPKIDSKPLSQSQQYNLSLNQEKGLNQPNFITLGKIL